VVGRDPKIDLALLKIEVTGLPPITLADSSKVQVGEPVMAIGNPFGLERTVTVGVVSATARATGERPWDKYIQTDAAINPGNSGGPLINAEGRMIGVNTTFYSPSGASIGIGFAIPANLARATLERIAGKPLTSPP
jgi:serine protease Do